MVATLEGNDGDQNAVWSGLSIGLITVLVGRLRELNLLDLDTLSLMQAMVESADRNLTDPDANSLAIMARLRRMLDAR